MMEIERISQCGRMATGWPKRPWNWKTYYAVNISKTKRGTARVI